MRSLFAVLGHRSFRLLWLGQTASTIGDQLVTVTLALYVTERFGRASDLGLVLAAYTVPLVVLVLVGGVWADRLPRRGVMVATDLVRATCHALLAVLVLTGTDHVWQLAAIGIVFGSAEAFFRPAYTGLVPQTVPEQDIQPASALVSASNTLAELGGPALATLLVVGLGAGTAFAVDSATFLLSAALLVRVRPRARTSATQAGDASLPAGAALPEAAPRTSVVAELRDGWQAFRERTWVSATVAAWCVTLCVGFAPYLVLGPVIARDEYGSVSIFGVIATVVGLGAVLGALVGLRWRPERPMVTALLGALTLPVLLLALGLGLPLGVVLGTAVVFGFGIALFDILWQTAIAERVPPELLSRVSSYDWMVSLALLPLGFVLAGPLGDAVGPQTVVLAGAGLTAVALGLALVPAQTRSMRRT